MAQTEHFGSKIYREGTTPNTRLLNTHKVKIYSFDADTQGGTFRQIGVLQSWGPSDSRSNTAVRGIGYGDQIAEVAVGATDLTASAEVFALYLRNIMQVFGYKAGVSGLVRSLKHHRWPFDVKEEIVMPEYVARDGGTPGSEADNGVFVNNAFNNAAHNAIITWYEGCWMNSYGRTYAVGDVSVSESTDLIVTDVYAPGTLYFEDILDTNHGERSALFQGPGAVAQR